MKIKITSFRGYNPERSPILRLAQFIMSFVELGMVGLLRFER